MKPLKIRAKNFRAIDLTEYTFVPGVTGVCAKNGDGKSTLINDIPLFAFTGNTPAHFTKAQALRWGTQAGSVEWDFMHNGRKYIMSRNLHNSKACLEDTVTGEKITSHAEIKAFLEKEVFGTSFSLIQETRFVPQGDLADIISMTYTDRMVWFQKLAGLARLENLRGILQEAINKIPTYPDRTLDITTINDRLHVVEVRLGELAVKLPKLRTFLSTSGAMATKLEAARAQISEAEYQKSLTAGAETLAGKEIAITDAKNKLAAVTIPDDCSLGVEDQVKADWYRTWKKSSEELEREHAQYLGAEADFELYSQDLPEKTKQADDLDAASDTLTNQSIAMKPTAEMAEKGICPTCKREFKFDRDPAYIVKEFKELEGKRIVAQRAASTARLDLTSLKEKLTIATSHKSVIAARIKQLTATVKESEHNQHFDIKAYEDQMKVHAQYETLASLRRDLKFKLEVALSARDRFEVSFQQLKETPYISDEKKAEYTEWLAKYKKVEETVTALLMEQSSLETERTLKKEQLDGFLSEGLKASTTNDTLQLFSKARDVLHRDRLPKILMQKLLAGLNKRLLYYLSTFEIPFTARISDDFEFLVSFPEKGVRDEPANSALSGGQKVTLAIAFRFSLAESMGASVPVLVLDEPTLMLDEDNVEAVKKVMKKVREHAEKGLYIFVCSHDPSLTSSFTRVLTI
jgi:DNA repair exonuclease SbcCD ATPase subunit